MKRLFLFAAYDPDGIVGDSLIYHLKALSAHGDIVLAADNDFNPGELEKLRPFVKHAEASRHGEYDFGSYKRAFCAAVSKFGIESYETLYLVNDSVFGPLSDIGASLESMENLGTPAFGLVFNPNRRNPHLQSWFMGFRKSVFLSDWFSEFMLSVKALKSKSDVCIMYETGLTAMLGVHGVNYAALYRVGGKGIYNSVRKLYCRGLPYVKKSSFTRHCGSLGAQLKYVMDRVDADCRSAILSDAARLFGKEYMDSLFTRNVFRISYRYLSYLCNKLFS